MKKFLSMMFAVSLMLSLCACGEKASEDAGTTQAQSGNATVGGETAGDASVGTNTLATKIGTSENKYYAYSSFLATGMYGIMSPDGKHDSGSIYYDIEGFANSKYYSVKTKANTDETIKTVSDLNHAKLIDFNGETVSEGYFDYEKLSDRFYRAAKAVEITEERSDYFFTDAYFALQSKDGDVRINADFYVLDVETGKIVDGVKFNKYNEVEVHGAYIRFKNDAGEWKVVNADGYDVPDGAKFVGADYEYYLLTDGNMVTVYNHKNEVMFMRDADTGYIPYAFTGGYFVARKSADNGMVYILLDESGRPISPEIPTEGNSMDIKVYSSVMVKNGTICDLNGNVYREGTGKYGFTMNYGDDNTGYYFFKSTENIVMLDKYSNVLFEAADTTDSYKFDTVVGAAYKEVDGKCYWFNLKDKDFTICAESRAPLAEGLVEVKQADNTKSIVDVDTGDVLISGYNNYDVRRDGKDVYILASTFDGPTSDIYLIEG